MTKGEIVVFEESCKGCGYCERFCARGCISMSQDRVNAAGFPVAVFVERGKCNGCGVCVWMCPCFAIEAYRYK